MLCKCKIHCTMKKEFCLYVYLANVFQQSKFIGSPITRKVFCQRVLCTAKFYGYFKTVGVQVIPVLHSS